MIICGWCGRPTTETPNCSACGHEDPVKPWRQRGIDPPDPIAERIDWATRRLQGQGKPITDEALAEVLDVSPRTLGRWRRKMSD